MKVYTYESLPHEYSYAQNFQTTIAMPLISGEYVTVLLECINFNIVSTQFLKVKCKIIHH